MGCQGRLDAGAGLEHPTLGAARVYGTFEKPCWQRRRNLPISTSENCRSKRSNYICISNGTSRTMRCGHSDGVMRARDILSL